MNPSKLTPGKIRMAGMSGAALCSLIWLFGTAAIFLAQTPTT
jgi:hypothetical protein